jgi:hypothetical protein
MLWVKSSFLLSSAEGSQAGIAEFFGAGFLRADDNTALTLDFYTLEGGLFDQLLLRTGQDLTPPRTPGE